MKRNLLCWIILTILSCISASAAPVFWPGNGHSYEPVPVPGGITWEDARAAATAGGGYLATITSTAENAFVFGLIDDPQYWYVLPTSGGAFVDGPWLGGHQPPGSSEPADGWRWVTAESFAYNNWAPDALWIRAQPDDSGGQDALHYWGFSPRSSADDRTAYWDDVSRQGSMAGYIIERSIPDQGKSLGLLLVSLSFLLVMGSPWLKPGLPSGDKTTSP